MRCEVNMGTGRRGSFFGLLFFALFWCSITGVFVGFIVHSFWRAADAQLR